MAYDPNRQERYDPDRTTEAQDLDFESGTTGLKSVDTGQAIKELAYDLNRIQDLIDAINTILASDDQTRSEALLTIIAITLQEMLEELKRTNFLLAEIVDEPV